MDEGENKLNENEKGRFIEWQKVLSTRAKLEEDFNKITNKQTKEAYSLNQDLVLVSLYSLTPPLRDEPKTLKSTKKVEDKGDWVFFSRNGSVVLELNEVKKRHDYVRIPSNDDLSEILKQSYKLYPRVALFTDINKFPSLTKQVANKTVGDRLLRIFKYWGNNIGSSILRSSFVTHVEGEHPLTYNERYQYALKMRTSTEQILLSYKKILDAPALLHGNIIINAPTKEDYEKSK